jgi:Glycosyltransferase family 87
VNIIRKRTLLMGLLGVQLAIHGMLFWHDWHLARRGYPDFTAFYTAGTVVRLGLSHHMYDPALQQRVQYSFAPEVRIRNGPLPYIHPPFEALLFLPLSLLDYATALVVWDVFILITLGSVFFLLRGCAPILESLPLIGWIAIWLAFFPVFGCLLQGQDSVLLLLLCTLGFRALTRNSDFLAGGWLALGTFKFQFVIPLVLLLVLWKRRRVGLGFVATGLVLTALSAGLVGWNGLFKYPGYVLKLARLPGFGEVSPELIPNLRGLIEGWPLGTSSSVLSGIVIGASVILFVFAYLKGRVLARQHFNLQFSLATIVAVLIAWHTNAHDLSVLVLPLVLLAQYCKSLPADAPQGKWALLVPVVPILISPLWLVLWLDIGKVNLMAIPLLWWVWATVKEISHASLPMHAGQQHVSLC